MLLRLPGLRMSLLPDVTWWILRHRLINILDFLKKPSFHDPCSLLSINIWRQAKPESFKNPKTYSSWPQIGKRLLLNLVETWKASEACTPPVCQSPLKPGFRESSFIGPASSLEWCWVLRRVPSEESSRGCINLSCSFGTISKECLKAGDCWSGCKWLERLTKKKKKRPGTKVEFFLLHISGCNIL